MTGDVGRRRVRSPSARFALATTGVMTALGAWLAASGLQARDALASTRAELTAMRESVTRQNAGAAESAMQRAELSARRARSLTSGLPWRAVGAVPVAGRSFRVVSGVADGAADATEALRRLTTTSAVLSPDRLRRQDGTFDLAAVREAEREAQAAHRGLEAAGETLARLPARHVLPPVAAARAELERSVLQLADAAQALSRATALAPPLLGEDRPRRFLMLVQQTSESRGTGGIVGGFAVLRTAGGRITVERTGSNAELIRGNGPIPRPPGLADDYVRRFAPSGLLSRWENANLSPDLPAAARIWAERWRRQSGQRVDGVGVTDAIGLASLLRGSPPLRPRPGVVVGAQDLPEYLGVRQYAGFSIAEQLRRKDELGGVAAAAASRLVASRGRELQQVVHGLVDAVRSGHLKLASDDPALAPALAAAGVDGALPRGAAPVALVSTYNTTGGKLDYFLQRRIEYHAGACRGGRRPSVVVVQLRNEAPAGGLPPYVDFRIDQGRRTRSTTNGVVLSVHGTRGATLTSATLDGRPLSADELVEAHEQGLPVWQLQLDLPRGISRVLSLQLVEPATAGEPRVPEQPLAVPARVRVDVPPC